MHKEHLPARILVRTDVDYTRMDARSFAAQDEPTRPLMYIQSAVNGRAVEVFKEVFGTSFFAVRAQMKEEAKRARRLVQGVRETIGFRDFAEWYAHPEDEVIFPIDDDDVFHPDLAALARMRPGAGLVVWQWTGLGFHPWGERPALHHSHGPALLSNNWGVRKSFLKAHMTPEEAQRFLCDHGAAQVWMIGHLGLEHPDGWDPGMGAFFLELWGPSVHFVPERYSIQYLHLASLYLLCLSTQVTDLQTRLRALALDEVVPIPGDLEWARRSIDAYEGLIRRLSESRRAVRSSA